MPQSRKWQKQRKQTKEHIECTHITFTVTFRRIIDPQMNLFLEIFFGGTVVVKEEKYNFSFLV
jgi:hypothetical protein